MNTKKKNDNADWKSLDAQLRENKLNHVLVLFGEERYLLLQYRDKIINSLTGYDDTMNFTRFEGEGVTEEEIIDLSETLPFFADYRVILVENSKLFSTQSSKLADYIDSIPDTTYLIFCEGEKLDGRNVLTKAVKKISPPFCFDRVDPVTLKRWLMSRLKREKKQMADDAYELFIARTGNDMALIDTELEKLFCYTMGRDAIYREDVEELTSIQISDQVFDMIDALVAHNRQKAFDLYYELLALKVAPVKTLSLIGRQFRILLSVKSMSASGKSNAEIESKLKIRFANKYLAQCRGFKSISEIKDVLEYIDELDHAFKCGELEDQLAVEMFLLKYC